MADTLKYSVERNLITADPNDGRAVIHNQKSIDEEQVEKEMVSEGTGLTLPQSKAYFAKLFQIVEGHIALGDRVNLPIVSIRPTITGKFTDLNDSYDSLRHRVRIRVSAGLRLRKLEKTIKPEKVKSNGPSVPELLEFIDAASGEKNRIATPGGIASLHGYNLKFDQADPTQGLMFVLVDNPLQIIPVVQFTSIKPSEIHFLVPAMPPGNYRVEVKAILRNRKVLRSGTLDDIIEVE